MWNFHNFFKFKEGLNQHGSTIPARNILFSMWHRWRGDCCIGGTHITFANLLNFVCIREFSHEQMKNSGENRKTENKALNKSLLCSKLAKQGSVSPSPNIYWFGNKAQCMTFKMPCLTFMSTFSSLLHRFRLCSILQMHKF